MLLSVRIATGFVFTIFWGWLERPSHWNPSSISWIASEGYDPGVKHVVPGVAVGQRHIATGKTRGGISVIDSNNRL
jgi:hypothetical protein